MKGPNPCFFFCAQVTAAVGKRGVRALINNAGKVVLAPVEFMPMEVFEDQLQVSRRHAFMSECIFLLQGSLISQLVVITSPAD